MFQPAAAKLDAFRHSRRKLDELLVQQGHTAFQRHGHAHFVGQQEQIVRKLRLGIDAEHAVEIVIARGLVKSVS